MCREQGTAFAAIALFLLYLAGCATVEQVLRMDAWGWPRPPPCKTYEGPDRPIDEIALIMEIGFSYAGIYAVCVDESCSFATERIFAHWGEDPRECEGYVHALATGSPLSLHFAMMTDTGTFFFYTRMYRWGSLTFTPKAGRVYLFIRDAKGSGISEEQVNQCRIVDAGEIAAAGEWSREWTEDWSEEWVRKWARGLYHDAEPRRGTVVASDLDCSRTRPAVPPDPGYLTRSGVAYWPD
jgi:hypothetical protein